MSDEQMHAAVWAAIDEVARRRGCSVQALALESGSNRCVFGRARRVTPEGKLCWPTTSTITKVLILVGMSFTEFGALVDQCAAASAVNLKVAA